MLCEREFGEVGEVSGRDKAEPRMSTNCRENASPVFFHCSQWCAQNSTVKVVKI